MESSHTTTQDPPESRGPGRYDASGAVTYDAADTPNPRIGRIPPRLSPAERERELASVEQLIRTCQCGVIPGGVLAQLQQLARYAPAHAEGSGCPRCRPIPAQLITQLADAITTAVPA
jgi:hypothetical protein